jgi:ribosome-associated protein
MEPDLIINNLVIKGSELMISAARSSGPGGQHVNKTNSKVILRFDIKNSNSLTDQQKTMLLERLHNRLVGDGELLIHVESERSQIKNRAIAKERLEKLIKEALVPKKKRIATKAHKSSHEKRIKSKKMRGLLKSLRKNFE